MADADFSNTLLQADNGDVLVKTGPGAYGGTPVTQTGVPNAINKNDSVTSPIRRKHCNNSGPKKDQ